MRPDTPDSLDSLDDFIEKDDAPSDDPDFQAASSESESESEPESEPVSDDDDDGDLDRELRNLEDRSTDDSETERGLMRHVSLRLAGVDRGRMRPGTAAVAVAESAGAGMAGVAGANIRSGKRQRTATRRLVDELYAEEGEDSCRAILLQDVPASEMAAALLDDQLSDDDEIGTSDSSDGDDDDADADGAR